MKYVTLLKAMSVVCLIAAGMANAKFKMTLTFREEYNSCSGHCVQYKVIKGKDYEFPVEFLQGENMYLEDFAKNGVMTLEPLETITKIKPGEDYPPASAPWLHIKLRYADYPDDHEYLKSEMVAMLKLISCTATLGWPSR